MKKIPTIEVIFTTLHSGGKFDKNSYKVSGGLHGVGLSVVNACSEWAVITVWRDGKKFQVKVGKGKIIDHIQELPLDRDPGQTGTEINFYPDDTIFEGLHSEESGYIFDYEILANRLRDLAFLNPIKITLTDKRGEEEKKEVYYNTGGVSDFVKYLNENKKGPSRRTNSLYERQRRGHC